MPRLHSLDSHGQDLRQKIVIMVSEEKRKFQFLLPDFLLDLLSARRHFFDLGAAQ
jgi:hypothetical protein